jgi:hypothetical protein
VVWEHGNGAKVFVGGYKTGLNAVFLEQEHVTLVINTAPSLAKILGPKYQSQKKRVQDKLVSHTRELILDWEDSLGQLLDVDILLTAVKTAEREIEAGEHLYITDHSKTLPRSCKCITAGGSVLVHCAQGKSRSAVVAAAFLARRAPELGVAEALRVLRLKRKMAEPNPSFVQQLVNMEKMLFSD